jgi:hypothetical protein
LSHIFVSQLTTAKPGLRALITQPEEDDDEEHFEDAPDSDDEKDSDKKPKAAATSAFSHSTKYDGRKRDPRYANADKTCLWELVRIYLNSLLSFTQCPEPSGLNISCVISITRFDSHATIIHLFVNLLKRC